MHAMEDRDRLARLKAAFEATGLSQAEFARLTKQPSANITRWLNGENRVAARKLPILASALGVSVEFLLTGHERAADPTTGYSDEEKVAVPRLLRVAAGNPINIF